MHSTAPRLIATWHGLRRLVERRIDLRLVEQAITQPVWRVHPDRRKGRWTTQMVSKYLLPRSLAAVPAQADLVVAVGAGRQMITAYWLGHAEAPKAAAAVAEGARA